ncbi:cell division protein ZapA [Paenibacillus darwinianus]|uniref:cell division protein ZapA n=1 Tax=Paenibacillus darwinianus TaxID=1380763 RepID=UPI0009DD7EE2|nr:cell division protein ZapA [Paenibacillus darwinianus]
MDAERTRVTVDIYGHQYRLTGHTNVDYMKRVAALVDENMHKLAKGYPRLDMPRIAVLSAVHMADEVFRLRRENERLLEEEAKRKLVSAELDEARSMVLALREELSGVRLHAQEEAGRIRSEADSLQIRAIFWSGIEEIGRKRKPPQRMSSNRTIRCGLVFLWTPSSTKHKLNGRKNRSWMPNELG